VVTAEAIQTKAAAGILGISTRTLQMMAARGEIPGAALIGRRWTFNEEALRRWRRSKEVPCPKISTVAETHGGGGPHLTAANTVKAYEQILRLKPAKGSRTSARG
jgi:excisionase family DNA binding protein